MYDSAPGEGPSRQVGGFMSIQSRQGFLDAVPRLNKNVHVEELPSNLPCVPGPFFKLVWGSAGPPYAAADSGIDATHPGLQGITLNKGFPDDYKTDTCGHGTHVAGTIAARST